MYNVWAGQVLSYIISMLYSGKVFGHVFLQNQSSLCGPVYMYVDQHNTYNIMGDLLLCASEYVCEAKTLVASSLLDQFPINAVAGSFCIYRLHIFRYKLSNAKLNNKHHAYLSTAIYTVNNAK